MKELRDALPAGAPAETLRGAMNRLSEVLQKAGGAVYGAAQGASGPEAAPGGDAETFAEEGTVEGEYQEV